MKIVQRLFIAFGLLFVVLMIFGSLSGDDYKAEREKLLTEHCAMNWEEMTGPEKLKALQEFIENNGIEPENQKSIGMEAYELLRKSVKYPNTITIDGEEPQYAVFFSDHEGIIENVSEGIIDFRKDFMAKNKLNMDVRSQMFIQIKYTAGCENFEVLDFQVN